MSTDRKMAVLEVGTSEIPAGYIPRAKEQLYSLVREGLEASGLACGDPVVLATPRRLVVFIGDIPPRGEESVEEVRGPSAEVAFRDGEPTKAAEGFARSQGVSVEDLVLRDEEKGSYAYALKRDPGGPAMDILAGLFTEAVSGINFPRTMRWGEGKHSFARPIRWVLALLGEDVIPVELAGVMADRESFGPRYNPRTVSVPRAADYRALVEETGIVLDERDRLDAIEDACRKIAGSVNCSPVLDPGLLEEVSYLVEYPTVLLGDIPDEFMQVPRIVIETAMTSHLRFFPVEDESGDLAPKFLSVINGTETMITTVRPGNELVLNSRLADARFFWEEDRRRDLAEYARELDTVVFHEGLGSLADRTARMGEIVQALSRSGHLDDDTAVHLARAVRLAKADLLTLMVGEFPDLQGRIGEEYARYSGEPEPVCRALGEQYLPAGSRGAMPETDVGTWLALVDKVDHLVGGFRASLVGTGSEDPYGMRRAATGILRILHSMGDIGLSSVIGPATGAHGAGDDANLHSDLLEYLTRRLARMMADEGFAPEVISGVLDRRWDIVSDVWDRALQVSDFLGEPEAEDMLTAWRRCRNLGQKGTPLEEIVPEEFESAEGVALARAFLEFEGEAEALLASADYTGFFRRASRLRKPVDDFLDSVMVMVPDEELKERRLGLLARIDELISKPMEWGELPG